MIDHILERRLVIDRPRPDVFAFFADAGRVRQLTPPWVRLEHVRGPVQLTAGAVVDYRMLLFGLPLAWRGFVREFDPPFRYLEVQLRGPFARWEHRHRFLARGAATLMEDRLVYRLPFGWAGHAAHVALVARMMRAAWTYRTERIEALVGPVSPGES
jgi:hypothetical protein